MMAASRELKKMIGSAVWCAPSSEDRGKVLRAILRDERELVIDLLFEGYTYCATLKRQQGDQFVGRWTCRGHADTGSATATLYSSSEGQLLVGEWTEGTDRYDWWVKMEVVSSFPDER